MEITDIFSLFLVVLSTFLGATGSYFFKISSNKMRISSIYGLLSTLFNPFLFAGFSLFFSSSLVYLYALSGNALTVIYPLSSLSYVWTLFIGYWFLDEKRIGVAKVFGIFFIIMGIILVVTG